ncbi:cation diffusion facilitator family transporter [Thiomicrorhabdus sp. ZW0627]|uniref:cation diffusion facilitator family transporter n=1 Tax=Thiomicrorhabdus sp. ZW0627 TaxID=3039774 RepID=UPI0024367F54|nr:cation diffusion facilitator family transporter [Thiomicrorhabdus sp. ZW0627]MDG6774537.1 cation diffusion facilitator family transporter [Thiomicrorhabdus sp. ZW0627]
MDVQPVSHHHNHIAEANEHNQRKVLIAAIITGSYMLVEIIGGLWVNSIALVADGVHMLMDAVALAIAWWGFHMSKKPANERMTFGYQRVQVLTAFINGFTLLLIVGGIVVMAVQRFFEPQEILGKEMFLLALIGLLNNLVVFWILHSGDQHNMNMRGATLHFLGDTLGSVAVIAGAILIYFTDWTPIDPILSLLIAVIIGIGAYRLTREATHVLLEGVPAGYEIKDIASDLECRFEYLTAVHHIHLWAISDDQVMMTLHAKTDLEHINDATLSEIKQYLLDEHKVHHVTLQLESDWTEVKG